MRIWNYDLLWINFLHNNKNNKIIYEWKLKNWLYKYWIVNSFLGESMKLGAILAGIGTAVVSVGAYCNDNIDYIYHIKILKNKDRKWKKKTDYTENSKNSSN
jgi:hypothetical protein